MEAGSLVDDTERDAVLREGANDIYDLLEVVVAGEGDHVALVPSLGHEPYAHLGHDTEVGLTEDAVHRGSIRVLECLPAGIVRAILAR